VYFFVGSFFILSDYFIKSRMNEDYIARSAQLALLLEVSAYPKHSNVDRTHDFTDTSYEHFIASSVALYPVLREAAVGEKGVGGLIIAGVEESMT
jgi:triphosphoribosyl-dephospho-CoA synthase